METVPCNIEFRIPNEEVCCQIIFYDFRCVFYRIVLFCIVVGSRRLMPLDALQPKAYCTNPGL